MVVRKRLKILCTAVKTFDNPSTDNVVNMGIQTALTAGGMGATKGLVKPGMRVSRNLYVTGRGAKAANAGLVMRIGGISLMAKAVVNMESNGSRQNINNPLPENTPAW